MRATRLDAEATAKLDAYLRALGHRLEARVDGAQIGAPARGAPQRLDASVGARGREAGAADVKHDDDGTTKGDTTR